MREWRRSSGPQRGTRSEGWGGGRIRSREYGIREPEFRCFLQDTAERVAEVNLW